MICVDVRTKRRIAEDIWLFDLQPVGSEPLPPYRAGAHIDVEVRPGLIRQYSLCTEPAQVGVYQIGVLREPHSRGGSSAMADEIQVGSRLRISAPRQLFGLSTPALPARLFAGGIGLTPILAMAYELAQTGADFELHYAGRSRSRLAFLDALVKAPLCDHVRVHVDEEAGGLFDAPAAVRSRKDHEQLYVCGPRPFMDAVRSAALAEGWPDGAIHQEHFSAGATAIDGDRPFWLHLAKAGLQIPVAADQTALEALLAAGVEMAYSCEGGVCGTCLTRVLEGVPDHRDLILAPEEHAANDSFTPCCSRSLTPVLLLDL